MELHWASGRKLATFLLLTGLGFLLVSPKQAWTRDEAKFNSLHGRRVLVSSATPIWQLDLRGTGFTPLEQGYGAGVIWFHRNPLCFIARENVVVNFVTREAAVGLPHRGSADESLPYRLHALFVDTNSGILRTAREWPTASQNASVLPAAQGNFIALTPDELWLYSDDFRLLAERTLSLSARADGGSGNFSCSPNGKSLLISYGIKPSEVPGWDPHRSTQYYGYEWIGLESLKVRRSWRENSAENLWKGKENFHVVGGSPGSIFNNQVIRPFYNGFLERELDGPLRWIRFSRPVDNFGPFDFLTSQLIISERQSVLRHWSGNITLIRTDGEVVFQERFPDWEQLRWLVASADGGRFALAVYRGRGGSEVLDIGAHYTLERIMVFDVNAAQWVYTISTKSQGIKDLAGLALSPDGSLLALISSDGKLRLYRLPRTAFTPR